MIGVETLEMESKSVVERSLGALWIAFGIGTIICLGVIVGASMLLELVFSKELEGIYLYLICTAGLVAGAAYGVWAAREYWRDNA